MGLSFYLLEDAFSSSFFVFSPPKFSWKPSGCRSPRGLSFIRERGGGHKVVPPQNLLYFHLRTFFFHLVRNRRGRECRGRGGRQLFFREFVRPPRGPARACRDAGWRSLLPARLVHYFSFSTACLFLSFFCKVGHRSPLFRHSCLTFIFETSFSGEERW